MSLKVKDIGEKKLVKYMMDNCNTITPDDCAITSLNNNLDLISTTDMLIQSHHFPDFMNYFEMGFKAVTVNVSDIAAMGAEPIGFLLSIALPQDLFFKDFKEIFQGVLKACEYYNIPLIGGDTNEASEIIISGTALGLTDKAIMKNTYNCNDLIAVTGDLGKQALDFYKGTYHSPKAKLHEGQILKNNGATAITDITDGLASELYEIYNLKNGFTIYEDKLAIDKEFRQEASKLNLDPLDLILYFGEDFELLFTFPKSKYKDLKKILDFKVIGEVSNDNTIEIVLSNGDRKLLMNKGFNHFKGDENEI